jgi:hypothetical protein
MKRPTVSVNENPRKRRPGRPATGVDPVMAFRLPEALKKRVEKEAEARGEKPADTLRRIVEEAFKGKRNGR